MTSGYRQFTVCWVPPPSDPLARFGAAWTGWCPESAERRPREHSPRAGLDLHRMTKETSRLGFHGIFHGPFRLQDASRIWSLEHALRTLADETRAVTIRKIGIAVVGGRVALVPEIRSRALEDLGRRIRLLAENFEERSESVTVVNDVRTAQTGVPVRPDDCFHLPLTDRLGTETASRIALRLRPLVQAMLGGSHTIGDLCLLADPGRPRRARVRDRYAVFDGTGGTGSTFACCGPRVYAPLTGPDRLAEAV